MLPGERRLALGGLAVIGVGFGFARYGYGLFLPPIRQEFDLSVGFVGVIASAVYVGYLIALGLVGLLARRAGPRFLVALGGVCATLGIAMVAAAGTIAILAAGLLLAGTSAAWAWAPYSDAVDLAVRPSLRERVLAIVPAGTAIGTAVVGPMALVTSAGDWRAAWWVMAALSLLATIYNICVVPRRSKEPVNGAPAPTGKLAIFLQPRTFPLYGTAFGYGLAGSFYWNYATEAIGRQAASPQLPALFWTVMGLAGIAGVLAGRLLATCGLRRSTFAIFTGLALAIGLLAVAPGSPIAAGASAILYGPAFIAGSSLLAVWGYQLFPHQPTRGFSIVLVWLALGTIVGPATLGLLAEAAELQLAFGATAITALATASLGLAVRSGKEVRTS